MSETASQKSEMRPRRLVVLVPLIVFAGLTALFLVRLSAGDPSLIPSALIGHPVPQTALPPIAGLKRDGAAVSRPLRQSIRRHGRRQQWPRGNRMGRLWRTGNLRHRP